MLDSVCLEIVLILTQIGARFAPNIPHAQKSIWTHPMVVLGDEAQVEARLDHSKILLNLTQDRSTVCGERTTASEIILDAPDGTPSDVGHVESHFGPFGDSAGVGSG
jgi:hypothetical protein